MKNEALFNQTVDILAKAYFAETLIHGSACACAVGNLVAANGDWSYNGSWAAVVLCPDLFLEGVVREQIEATGYTVRQIIRIERAFEKVRPIAVMPSLDPDGYLGLLSVLDVLFEIHEVGADDRAGRIIQRQAQPCEEAV